MSEEDLNQSANILLYDEVQLIGYGETRGQGPYIKLRLSDPDHLKLFRGLDTGNSKKAGHVLNVVISQGDIVPAEDKPKDGPYKDEAIQLRRTGTLIVPDVIKHIGTDEEFAAWIQKMPCMVCGGGDWVVEIGENRCEAAHVRRANNSGTAWKGLYIRVPLCHEDHILQQHQHGESKLYERKQSIRKCKVYQSPKDWMVAKAQEYLERWAWETLRTELGYQSWNQVPPKILVAWFMDHEIDQKYLPYCYK